MVKTKLKGNGLARRVYDEIASSGARLYTLFDPGARRSYITKTAANRIKLKIESIGRQFVVGLGGKERIIKEDVTLKGNIHGLPLRLHLYVTDRLGEDENGREIELLFGILSLEEWLIELDLQNKCLDLSKYRKEYIEY